MGRRRRLLSRLGVVAAPVLLLALGLVGFRVWKWASVPGDAPVVGLSLDTSWHHRLGLAQAAYETALTRAGARTDSIRPGGQPAASFLDGIDALLLCGGGDVDPALSGSPPDGARLVDREHDELELALVHGALARGMPVLGICRGHQLLNVAHGGTLANLRDHPERGPHHGIEPSSLEAHAVTVVADSRLARLIGAGTRVVNSFHGQAVDRLGEGLEVAARADDGLIEALERNDLPFVIGLQWHPEIHALEDTGALAVFEGLVAAAAEYRTKKKTTKKTKTP